MFGKPVNLIPIKSLHSTVDETIATVECNNFDQYKELPKAIEVDGKILCKTGWSSDDFIACYKSDFVLGKPLDGYYTHLLIDADSLKKTFLICDSDSEAEKWANYNFNSSNMNLYRLTHLNISK